MGRALTRQSNKQRSLKHGKPFHSKYHKHQNPTQAPKEEKIDLKLIKLTKD